ncbi:MAG: peptide chain release factor N(5)-glutamine methyltransferase [Pseudomonadota bacterium]|nr:peptide chain release factor N(5)-glutamine methyltransferase [Pseudomonadota bacterium]
MTLGEALSAAQAALAAVTDTPRLDAEWLLEHVTALDRPQLLIRADDALDEASSARYFALVERRRRGEPLAYLTGERGFWSLNLKVSADVLVPRPETELLVEWSLLLIAELDRPVIADLGTGSGALALALATERPDAIVDATDVSAAALVIAQGNAERLGLQRVRFQRGHWLEPLADQAYDLLVSNPPYIAANDAHLQALQYEPMLALSDGADGLGALREIISSAPAHLRRNGWLMVEHGYDQGAAVRDLFARTGFSAIETRRDLGGQERATAGCWSSGAVSA